MDLPAVLTLNRISRFFRRPRQSAGNVYYAKLNTPHGASYKIGFTTKSTLHERMAYNGAGDEKLIDKVLFFTPHTKAWDVEQTLLDHFRKQRALKRGNDPTQPLYKNGQSELFASDILGLDAELYEPRMVTNLVPSAESSKQAMSGCLGVIIGVILAPFTLGFLLFFIFSGITEFFASTQSPVMLEKQELLTPERPTHPEPIQALIAFLDMPQPPTQV